MTPRAHRLERIAKVRPEWGPIRHVVASPDDRSCVLLTETPEGIHRVVFGGRVLAETGPDEPVPMSLSFDGTKLAVARRVIEGGRASYRIFVNGEPAYEARLGTVHHLDWLSNERLAWDGWNDGEHGRVDDGGVRRFVNGLDVTDSLDFEPVLVERMRHAIRVKEGCKAYMINEDGSRTMPVPVAPGTDRWHWFDAVSPARGADGRERPEEVWDRANKSVRVSYRGVSGPIFDAIETGGGMRPYAMNADGRRVAYAGIRYAGVAKAMSRAVGGAIGRVEGEPRGLSRLWAWPLALLFNPYFGIGHAYIEGSRRYFLVDHDREWQKGYRFAGDHFYTPHDELVATCYGSDGPRVVIDEAEGLVFDAVTNVCHLAGEDAVAYLAMRGDEIVRVAVS